MGRTLGLIAIKGGVGKTTISAALAADLVNHFGKKVLLIDANYSAPNLGLHMDIIEPRKTIHDVLANRARIKSAIHNKYGVDVIPGAYSYPGRLNYLKLKDRIASVKEKYDFTIIDSSPSLNEEILSTMLAADNLFVVSTPDYPTLSCSLSASRLAKQRGRPISGIILNKIRDPRYELNLREVEEGVGIPVISRIPDDKNSVRALFTRIPITVYNRRSRFSRQVAKLSSTLTGTTEKVPFWKKFMMTKFMKDEVNREILKGSFYQSQLNDKKKK